VVEAPVTIAFVAPKNTMLFAAVALKFVPVIVTEVPIGPLDGVNEVIAGAGLTIVPLIVTAVPIGPLDGVNEVIVGCAVAPATIAANKTVSSRSRFFVFIGCRSLRGWT